MSQTDRLPPNIRLVSDVIDQNDGQAVLTDSPSDLTVYATSNNSIIPPWTDNTPTPPKTGGSVSFKGLFRSKGSFSSFGPQHQNSLFNTLRMSPPSDSQVALYSNGESTKRASQDVGESSGGMLHSGPSDLRRKRLSKNLFSNLGDSIRQATSRAQPREDGDKKEHPSIKGAHMPGGSSASLVPSSSHKEKKLNKKEKGKQKAYNKYAAAVPPKDNDEPEGMVNGSKLSPKSTPSHIVPRNVVFPLAGGSRSPGWDAPDNRLVEERPGKYPQSTHQYKMRIYTQLGAYYVISIGLDTSVGQISDILREKIVQANDCIPCDVYIKERGQERMLGPNECPAQLVKIKMEQAGYDAVDSQKLLGPESLNILLKFYYKRQSLEGEEQIHLDKFDFIDLAGKGLQTIPVILHQNADSIISLHLDRNPMLEIPLDFIQSCTTLRDLWLTHMSMKKVPTSVRHSTTLHRLNLSFNHIRDLDDAHLDEIKGLLALFLQNNRLEKLPVNFSQLRSLVALNISNNEFKVFPVAITELENLHDLDISFNMITELPKEIGKMRALERLVIVGNQIAAFPDEASNLVALRILDCKRNQISDLSLICMLPNLQSLSSDHNTVCALGLSLGPNLTTLDVSHNDITRLSLVRGPTDKSSYSLTFLDLSYGKLASLDDTLFSQLASLCTLKLDHNSIISIPESLGDLKCLEILSCTNNKLHTLPSTIGRLQQLHTLDAHNNSLTELPQGIWNCASLMKMNVSSNVINKCRRPSTASVGSLHTIPPLVHSLEKLYLGDNCLTDDDIKPLMILKGLIVLNLSFNKLASLPTAFFRDMVSLEELYLSGNRLTSLPAEDFPRLTRLTTVFLNGNKLRDLPQELSRVSSLTVLDVGSNLLNYNVYNWEFDWNWNFNTKLKYLNLSGNKRLQIKAGSTIMPMKQSSHVSVSGNTAMLSGFTSLSQLKVLGLMDVNITTTGKDITVDIPDENADRRVRTSLSTVCGMKYGIADSLSRNDCLTMIDLVHEFHGHGRNDEAVFAMFGQTHSSKHLKPGSSTNLLSKFLHDNFVNVFKTQLAAINDIHSRLDPATLTQTTKREGIKKALHWTFLKLNQELYFFTSGALKQAQGNASFPTSSQIQYFRVGASGVALYITNKTIYAANLGDSLAVVSRQGIYHEISKKHDPYDPVETARIRATEGSISPAGLVNDDVDVSRSFGYFHIFPTINARPDIFVYDLTDMDEFVIIANRGLWDYVPYQTAVDIARSAMFREEQTDPMHAAQKLRDIAISYGSSGSTMVMIILLTDLLKINLTDVVDYRTKRKQEVRDYELHRLLEAPAPIGHVNLVFTDIRNSAHLWEVNPGMPAAIKMHNSLLRHYLRLCGGHEVKAERDAFVCSFPTSLAAVWWCLTVQVELLNEQWPLEILECEDGKPIYDEEGRLIARGLSVRMGIHSGTPLRETDFITHRKNYFGPMVNQPTPIHSNALGGPIVCSLDIVREINAKVFESEKETEHSRLQTSQAIEGIRNLGVNVIFVTEFKLKSNELPEILHILYPRYLEGRHELKESIRDPTTSASRVPFSV